MQKITAKGIYTLLKRRNSEAVGTPSFEVKLSEKCIASVSVSYQNSLVETVIKDIYVSKEFESSLNGIGRFNLNSVKEDVQQEVNSITKNLHIATKKVLELIKYFLRHSDISEALFSVKEEQWSVDNVIFNCLPTTLYVSLGGNSIQPLRNDTIVSIQTTLTNGVKPLRAMRYLHRAKNENIPHYKWIDATIAAELAVKEVLIRANPSIETVLMEVPSPPLTKLYGIVLEKYLGEKTPYMKQIKRGAEVRNRLIHKPLLEKVDDQEAINYVRSIEAAIFHLLSKLYPDDSLIKNAYARTKLKNLIEKSIVIQENTHENSL